ncbi:MULTISPECIES: hypothetical protein [unclassified Thalassospira]|jgi:hypothetical protein|uniref:hypothetical protein n=1 Tax=unclassified Thalassospira TaxID=2648997 RepID=UPI000A1F1BD1|nr:hypothetical protein [Thalassospira sp. MCCC 1A01428]OSQ40262.1 hypothetical protein THS27_20460 [Thalassospira sp. MCCC 1A01428]
MARKADQNVAIGDQFRVTNAHSSVFEVLEIRDISPAPHALIVKISERRSPSLIAVSTLLNPNFYQRVFTEEPPKF